MPYVWAASSALRVRTSHTASWNDAATSATSMVTPVTLLGLHPAGDGGLEAGEREVETVPLEVLAAR